jgi:hypothetical protein
MALDDPSLSTDDDGTDAPAPISTQSFIGLKKWVKASLSKHSEWYKEARECYDFVAGRQWTEDEQLAFTDTGRPPIGFNLCGPTVDAVCGMEVNNRQQVKFYPRTLGDSQVNERLTSLGEWARDECQAEDEESAGFRDNVICGRGLTDTRLDFEEEPTGKVIVDRVDPLEAGVDPSASKANFTDARYIWRFKDLDTDEAEGMFPGVSWAALNATWASTADIEDGGEGNKRDYPDETRAGLRDDRRPKCVRVVEVQWWERVKAYMVALQPGEQPKQVSADDFEKLKELLDQQGIPTPQAQEVYVREYYRAFLGSSTMLASSDEEGEDAEPVEKIDCFSLAFMTGRWDRNKRYHYGVVRPLLDPQRIINKSLIQTQKILDTNAKGGYFIEKGAFANVRDAEKDMSDPSKNVVVADGALSANRIKERTPPSLPPALTALLELGQSGIYKVTGINLELLGAADREQAASLEYQRRQSAMTILSPLFDALRRYRKTQGLILISCLRRLPPGVLVRVVQDEDTQPQPGQMQPGQPPQPGQQPQQPQQGQQQAPQAPQQPGMPPAAPQQAFQPFDPAYFGLDKDEDRFDVIVDEAPTSPNQKEQTWAAIQPMLPAMSPQQQMVALKYSPLPSAAVADLTAAFQPQLPPEIQKQMADGQQQIKQLTDENTQLKADRSIEAAKVQTTAQRDSAKSQTEQFNAQTDRIHKVGQLGGDGGHEDGQQEMLIKAMEQRFDAMESQRQRDHDLIMQHLKNAGQIAASRVRADATADPAIETNDEVGA